jgi:hypothetical protein
LFDIEGSSAVADSSSLNTGELESSIVDGSIATRLAEHRRRCFLSNMFARASTQAWWSAELSRRVLLGAHCMMQSRGILGVVNCVFRLHAVSYLFLLCFGLYLDLYIRCRLCGG